MFAKRNIVFDFGNVLIRWEPLDYYTKFFGSKKKAHLFLTEICDAKWNARLDAGEPFDACVAEKIAEFPEWESAIRAYQTNWFDMIPGEVPGMLETVRSLKRDGYHHVYGLSNFSQETFPEALRRFPVLREIDNYVISGECEYIKPGVEIYLYFLRKFDLRAEDCLFLDDSAANADIAWRLGMDALVFNWRKSKLGLMLKNREQ